MLVPPEEGDERGALIEVRAGVDGVEAALFAGEVLTMYELATWKHRRMSPPR